MRRGVCCGLLALLAGLSGCSQPAPAPAPEPVAPKTELSQFRPSATVRELMQSLVAPSAQGIWDSVGTISNAKGTVNLEPRTDAEWAAVRRHAVALMESTNLLLIPGRHIAPAGSQVNKAEDA